MKQSNEQQAEVRNVTPTANNLCACAYLSVSTSACASLDSHYCERISPLCFAKAHKHGQKSRSVMRTKESKSEGPQHCSLKGVKNDRKGGKREGRYVGRDEKTKGRWKVGAGFLRPPGDF